MQGLQMSVIMLLPSNCALCVNSCATWMCSEDVLSRVLAQWELNAARELEDTRESRNSSRHEEVGSNCSCFLACLRGTSLAAASLSISCIS